MQIADGRKTVESIRAADEEKHKRLGVLRDIPENQDEHQSPMGGTQRALPLKITALPPRSFVPFWYKLTVRS